MAWSVCRQRSLLSVVHARALAATGARTESIAALAKGWPGPMSTCWRCWS
jgi:hypothetical protein